MEPREVVKNWVLAFNRGDADEVAKFYAKDAINHQVVQEPMEGRDAIREWTDPKGLRGCGFFNIVDDHIVFQRGYFNELNFLRQQGLPLPIE